MIVFSRRADGITVAAISNSAATAQISLYGAHVLSYVPKGQKDLLFMSGKSAFTVGKAIRGGIPVCFPWFGPNAEDASLPIHGFARLSQWTLVSVEETPDRTAVSLELVDTDETRRLWPNEFKLSLFISVGASLDMKLVLANSGKKAFVVSDALHSYFNVKNVKAVSVDGLDALSYIDRVGVKTVRGQVGPVRISGEADRVYLKSKSASVVDPGFKRIIKIGRKGFPDIVVWNPWIDRAKAMPDFGDEEYGSMICVEAASVFENAITLEPGKASTQKMTLESVPLE